MRPMRPLVQIAAIALALLRGIGELAKLQRWRLHERLSRHGR